jgi:predicted transcriptional regulator
MNTDSRQNYYEILDIKENASAQEIYNAYQKAKLTYCHDSKAVLAAFSPEEAAELRNLIEEAYQVLSNVDYRNVYEKRVMSNSYEAQDLTAQAIKVASENLFERVHPAIEEAPAIAVEAAVAVETVAAAPAMSAAAVTETAIQAVVEETAPQVDPAFENMIATKKEWSGEDLKQVREYRRLSYDELTDITKINPWYIAALEKMDPANLPVEVFVRGYVLQVAKALGLKEKTVADSYMRLFRKKIEN